MPSLCESERLLFFYGGLFRGPISHSHPQPNDHDDGSVVSFGHIASATDSVVAVGKKMPRSMPLITGQTNMSVPFLSSKANVEWDKVFGNTFLNFFFEGVEACGILEKRDIRSLSDSFPFSLYRGEKTPALPNKSNHVAEIAEDLVHSSARNLNWSGVASPESNLHVV